MYVYAILTSPEITPEAFSALPAFLQPLVPAALERATEVAQTQAPDVAMASSMALADISPLENPNISFAGCPRWPRRCWSGLGNRWTSHEIR